MRTGWIGLLALAGGLSACGGETARADADRIVVVAGPAVAVASATSGAVLARADPAPRPRADADAGRAASLQQAADATASSTYPDLPLDLLETATDAVPGDGRA